MSLEEDFVTTLSPTFAGRLHPSVAPAGVIQPYAVYMLVSWVPEFVLDGSIPNIASVRMAVDIFGRDKMEINALAEQAKSAAYAATLFKLTGANQFDVFEEPAVLYGVHIDFLLWRYE